jgi:hypothetical protein
MKPKPYFGMFNDITFSTKKLPQNGLFAKVSLNNPKFRQSGHPTRQHGQKYEY